MRGNEGPDPCPILNGFTNSHLNAHFKILWMTSNPNPKGNPCVFTTLISRADGKKTVWETVHSVCFRNQRRMRITKLWIKKLLSKQLL